MPECILFDLGGYTGFRSREWENYLKRLIRRRYPVYYVRQFFARQNKRWQQNDCIYDSLKKYLLYEFGILLPESSLFLVFNHHGQGLLPAEILTAICAVIEPLGLVLDHVVVVEPRLREAVGFPEIMVDPEDATLFENRAGICMIHIQQGYSHAFFWDRMKPDKFASEEFRLALTIRRQRPARSAQVYSVLAAVKSFAGMVEECRDPAIATQVHDLARFSNDPASQQAPEYRAVVDQKLEHMQAILQRQSRRAEARGQLLTLLDATNALRTLFREAIVIC